MDTDLVVNALIHTAFTLFLLALLLLPFRRRILASAAQAPWAMGVLFAVVALGVGDCTYRQQLHAPIFTYSAPAARYWINEAVNAPVREDRIKHVRRVALQSEYGGHIAWQTISKLPDLKTRCDLYAIVMATPKVRATGNIEEALKKECAA